MSSWCEGSTLAIRIGFTQLALCTAKANDVPLRQRLATSCYHSQFVLLGGASVRRSATPVRNRTRAAANGPPVLVKCWKPDRPIAAPGLHLKFFAMSPRPSSKEKRHVRGTYLCT
jgi:hypothetical protein